MAAASTDLSDRRWPVALTFNKSPARAHVLLILLRFARLFPCVINLIGGIGGGLDFFSMATVLIGLPVQRGT